MRRVFYLAVLLLMLSVSAFAQVLPAPSLLNFQGRLAKPDGTPVSNGNYSLRFSLWTAPAAGTELFSQTIDPVTVRNGVFAVLLNVGTGPSNLFHADRWLEIKIGANAPLSPRQQLVSVAFALKANTVPDGAITSAKIADGTITSADLASGTLNTLSWLLGGNSGTNPATQFLGTTDNQALVFKANNQRVMRYEFATASDALNDHIGVNTLGGHPGNSFTAGITAATIAGGGNVVNGNHFPNIVTDVGGTVGGGANNRAGNNSGTVLDSLYATVAGGFGNQATGSEAAVLGGLNNRASGARSVVGGGRNNIAANGLSTVPGGSDNEANGSVSFAAGNRAKANHAGAFVWADSQAADFASTGSNQFLVRAAGGVGVNITAPNAALHVAGNIEIDSDSTVSAAVGDGAFTILNAARTAGLHFDINDIRCIGTTVFTLNSTNECQTRINNTLFIQTDGTVGIGDSTPAFRLELPNTATDAGGRVRANAFTTYSSGRWKENVAPIENALDKVLRLNGVMFDWKPEHGGTHDVGFVAEDAGRVVPELVSWEQNGKYASGMKYDRVGALLVEAMKQQQKQIEAKDAELKEVKAELAALRALVEKLAKEQ